MLVLLLLAKRASPRRFAGFSRKGKPAGAHKSASTYAEARAAMFYFRHHFLIALPHLNNRRWTGARSVRRHYERWPTTDDQFAAKSIRRRFRDNCAASQDEGSTKMCQTRRLPSATTMVCALRRQSYGGNLRRSCPPRDHRFAHVVVLLISAASAPEDSCATFHKFSWLI